MHESALVADLIADLLTELSDGQEPDRVEIRALTAELMGDGVATPLLARDGRDVVGVLVLNECAAVYAAAGLARSANFTCAPTCDRRVWPASF